MEAVRNILSFNEAASAAQLQMKVHALHGIKLGIKSVQRAKLIYNRHTVDLANADLAELGMLCAAFKRANQGSVLDLLVDGDNKFNGFTIVPGSHVHVLPAVLNIVCADAY